LRAYDFARGQLVYAVGEPARNCLVVVRGALALNFSTPQGVSPFSLLGPGGIAGDLALIDGGPQPLACVAREATIAFEIDRIGFELLLRGGSVVARCASSRRSPPAWSGSCARPAPTWRGSRPSAPLGPLANPGARRPECAAS
jgi:Cyclic nucleotide-binding domain